MRRLNLIQGVFAAATFFTILSFFPVSFVKAFSENMSYGLWALLLILLFLHNRRVLVNNKILWMALAYICCIVGTKIAIRIGDYSYNSTFGIAKYLPYCIAFYFVGYNFTVHLEDSIHQLFRALCLSIFFISVVVLLRGGLESAKNQLGQLFGITAIFGVLILPRYVGQKQRMYYIIVGAISMITLLVVRSRTPVVGIAVVALVHFLPHSVKNGKTQVVRAFLMIVVVLGVIIAVEMGTLDNLFKGFSPQLGRDITLSEAVGDSESMDIVLSGRLTHYQIAWDDFIHHPLFGVGPWAYIDNFVMHTLRAGGLWYAFCLLPLVYGTLFFAPMRFRKAMLANQALPLEGMFYEALHAASIFYLIESMGEGYPPIGPGTSAFFLWLLIGIGDQMIAAASQAEKQSEKAVET